VVSATLIALAYTIANQGLRVGMRNSLLLLLLLLLKVTRCCVAQHFLK